MTTGKTIVLTRQTFVGKVMSLLFNMLSRLVIAFLPRSKSLLIPQLQSPSAVTLEPKKIVYLCFHCFPIFCHEMMGPDAMILVFWMLSFKPAFSLSSFTFIKRLFSSSLLSAIRVLSSAYLTCLERGMKRNLYMEIKLFFHNCYDKYGNIYLDGRKLWLIITHFFPLLSLYLPALLLHTASEFIIP